MDLNYKVEGSGEALVFIHGLSDSLLYWEYLASNLRDDYKVIRMDLRGHGESELGDDEITVDIYAEDINEISKVNLIGLSLGGAIAIDFALRYPDMVDSLVLMSTFYKADQYLTDILSQFKIALGNGFGDFYDLILPMVLCPNVIEENKQDLMLLKEVASQSANTEAYIRAVDACLGVDFEDELSQIEVPSLVLAGKYDDISLLGTQKELQNNMGNCELIVFDDVKHNILIGENNVKILEILKDFYKK